VQQCAAALVRGIQRRHRRVYVPRVMGLVQNARTLMISPVSEAVIGLGASKHIPQLEKETAALGRSFGSHTVGVGR
jgi:hypothetical protein